MRLPPVPKMPPHPKTLEECEKYFGKEVVTAHLTYQERVMSQWLGSQPEVCDICGSNIERHFVDGGTVYGPWAMMCDKCHREKGRGLGLGKGQRYEKNEEGDKVIWVKIAG